MPQQGSVKKFREVVDAGRVVGLPPVALTASFSWHPSRFYGDFAFFVPYVRLMRLCGDLPGCSLRTGFRMAP